MKTYQNFEEIWQDYPNACAVHIDKLYSQHSQQIEIRISEDIKYFGTRSWGLYLYDGWNLLDTVDSEDWLFTVFQQPHLKAISIALRQSISPDIFEKITLKNTKNLEKLRFTASTVCKKLTLPELPCLNTLQLGNFEVIDLVGKLQKLQHLHLSKIASLDLPALLTNLNPQTLQHLQVENVGKLQFFPNLGKIKKNTPLPAFTGFQDFQQLTHLGLSHNKIQGLPFELSALSQLKSIDLSANPLTVFPHDFLYLPALTALDISKTNLTKSQEVRTGAELIKLKQYFEKKNIAHEDRNTLFKILQQDAEVGKALTIPTLLRLSTLTTHTGILKKINALCEKKQTQNPFQNAQKIKNIAIIGKMPAMSFDSLKDFFDTHEVKITPKITQETEIVCVGEKPTELQVELLLQKNLPTAFAFQLKKYMEDLETPYLTISEPEITQNLETLLLSEDETNVLLALQMLKNGGMPDMVFEFLCLKLIDKTWDCKKELLKLLEKYSTPAQFILLKKVSLGNKKMSERLYLLFQSPDFEQTNLIRASFKYFTATVSSKYRHSFVYALKGVLWQSAGKGLELVLDRYLQEDGTLILENASMLLTKFPNTLQHNPRIKRLIALEALIKKGVKIAINSLPNLQEIEILYQKTANPNDLEERTAFFEALFPKIRLIFTPFKNHLNRY